MQDISLRLFGTQYTMGRSGPITPSNQPYRRPAGPQKREIYQSPGENRLDIVIVVFVVDRPADGFRAPLPATGIDSLPPASSIARTCARMALLFRRFSRTNPLYMTTKNASGQIVPSSRCRLISNRPVMMTDERYSASISPMAAATCLYRPVLGSHLRETRFKKAIRLISRRQATALPTPGEGGHPILTMNRRRNSFPPKAPTGSSTITLFPTGRTFQASNIRHIVESKLAQGASSMRRPSMKPTKQQQIQQH